MKIMELGNIWELSGIRQIKAVNPEVSFRVLKAAISQREDMWQYPIQKYPATEQEVAASSKRLHPINNFVFKLRLFN